MAKVYQNNTLASEQRNPKLHWNGEADGLPHIKHKVGFQPAQPGVRLKNCFPSHGEPQELQLDYLDLYLLFRWCSSDQPGAVLGCLGMVSGFWLHPSTNTQQALPNLKQLPAIHPVQR